LSNNFFGIPPPAAVALDQRMEMAMGTTELLAEKHRMN